MRVGAAGPRVAAVDTVQAAAGGEEGGRRGGQRKEGDRKQGGRGGKTTPCNQLSASEKQGKREDVF